MTAGMLAQRQPSFKECVTAHRSSDAAPTMIGVKRVTDAVDGGHLRMAIVVGERSVVG